MTIYCTKANCTGHAYMTGVCGLKYSVCCGLSGTGQPTPNCEKHLGKRIVPMKITLEPVGVDGTLAARDKTYGDFGRQARITQSLKLSMHELASWDLLPADMQESLEMIASKIARILNGDPNYVDSWHDIAGYATLIEKRLTKEKVQ